jgi:NitT/TauT family transport system substrate-binding protein
MKSRFTFLTTLAAATALGTRRASGQSGEVIRLAMGPVDQVSPIIYAQEAGLYKKHGVNMELSLLGSGSAVVAAVTGGSLELGMSSTLAAIVAISRGVPLTIVSGLSEYDSSKPDLAMLVLKDSPIRAPKDLVGKTLSGISLQDINSLANNAWLDKLGVDRSTMKYVEIPAAATLAAMEQGRIDASTLYEPFYSSYMATGKVRVLGYPFDAIGKRFSSGCISGTKAWVDTHRDAVAKFTRALAEACAYMTAHESESAGIIGRFAKVDTSNLANIHHSRRTTALPPGELQPVIDAALKYKVIQSSVPATEMLCACAPTR